MKRFSKLIFAAATAVVMFSNVSGQEMYKYSHLLETGVCWSGTNVPLAALQNDSKTLMNAVGLNVRYNWFFHDNVGVYGDLHVQANLMKADDYLSSIVANDGTLRGYEQFGKFRHYGYEPYKDGSRPSDNGAVWEGLSAGLVSRVGAGCFSFMPRIGIGAGLYHFRDYCCWRSENNDGSGDRVLVNRSYGKTCNAALDIHAGIQFNFAVSSRVFLFAEGSVIYSPMKIDLTDHTYQAYEYQSDVPDGNWLWPLFTYKGWVADGDTDAAVAGTRQIGWRFNARAGVGIYLGKSR